MTQTPSFGVEDIGPDKAREYLALNTHNRNLRPRAVNAYADDMRNGDWEWNGEAIKFATDGALLDGQHRLAAIVEADVTVPMLVVRGLPAAAQETMDTGVARKFSDVLKLRGEENYITLASTVRAIASWESGAKTAQAARATLSNRVLLHTLEKHPWVRDGVVTIRRAQSATSLPVTVGGLCWWLFTQIDSEDADFFFERLISAENHKAGDPIFTLRTLLLESSKSVAGDRNTRYLLAVTIKAWNKYRAGEECTRLSFRLGGAKPETFPEPK